MAESPVIYNDFPERLEKAVNAAIQARSSISVAMMIARGVDEDRIVINKQGKVIALLRHGKILGDQEAGQIVEAHREDTIGQETRGKLFDTYWDKADELVNRRTPDKDVLEYFEKIKIFYDKRAAEIMERAQKDMATRLHKGSHRLLSEAQRELLKQEFGDLYKEQVPADKKLPKDNKQGRIDGPSDMLKSLAQFEAGYNPGGPEAVIKSGLPATLKARTRDA